MTKTGQCPILPCYKVRYGHGNLCMAGPMVSWANTLGSQARQGPDPQVRTCEGHVRERESSAPFSHQRLFGALRNWGREMPHVPSLPASCQPWLPLGALRGPPVGVLQARTPLQASPFSAVILPVSPRYAQTSAVCSLLYFLSLSTSPTPSLFFREL